MEKHEKEFLKAYDDYFNAIYRHCYLRVLNKDLAEDITQETFIKTWKYITGGNKIKEIRPFLYRVATNLIIDNSRKKKPVPLDIETENSALIRLNNSGSIGQRHFIDKLEAEEAAKALEKLEEPYRQTMIMRFVDELPPREIAEILGESANAVSVRIHTGMQKLREILKNDYHYFDE